MTTQKAYQIYKLNYKFHSTTIDLDNNTNKEKWIEAFTHDCEIQESQHVCSKFIENVTARKLTDAFSYLISSQPQHLRKMKTVKQFQ